MSGAVAVDPVQRVGPCIAAPSSVRLSSSAASGWGGGPERTGEGWSGVAVGEVWLVQVTRGSQAVGGRR